MASDLAVPRSQHRHVAARDEIDLVEVECACVVCAAPTPEPLACCSSRCAGEAQRQLHRNAIQLRRLEARGGHELRRRLAERNGRLMSALMRWRPEEREELA